MYVSLTQLVFEIWLRNGMYPFHDFYAFDQQICHSFTNSQKFENFHFLSLLLKHMSYQDLYYLILKLLTRNFGFSRYDMALGVKALGLEDKVSMHSFLLRIHVFTLYQPSEGQRKVPFVCLFWFFSKKRREKLKKTGLLNKVITGGPLFSSHPVRLQIVRS